MIMKYCRVIRPPGWFPTSGIFYTISEGMIFPIDDEYPVYQEYCHRVEWFWGRGFVQYYWFYSSQVEIIDDYEVL
jgi:hypothetical protein